MQSGADLIDRSIVAIEGGYRLPEDVRRRLLFAFTEYRTNPGANLDKLLGLKPGRGQCSIAKRYRLQERGRLIVAHYREYHDDKKPYPASFDIADNLALLTFHENDANIDGSYKALFAELARLDIPIPKQRAVYDLLRNSLFQRKQVSPDRR